MKKLIITPGKLSLLQLCHFLQKPCKIELDPLSIPAIHQAANVVEDLILQNKTAYGINTGFGLLANKRINKEELEDLQRSIVLSHAAGVGNLLSDEMVALILLLKINSLAQGHSGIRLTTINALIKLLNKKIYPCIPEKGSVGASGDLAPLAHLSCVLLGEGFVRVKGETLPAKAGLQKADLSVLRLAPKEGLALLNGTQVSTALALQALFKTENLFNAAVITGALSVDAVLGSISPFDDRIHQVRRHKEQRQVASLYRELLENSEILLSHKRCEKVQDPYSFRCQPQVMGACLQQMTTAAKILVNEANAVTDNPLVFSDTNEIISGGNFHAEPVAMVADNLALAIAEIAALSERRLAVLIDPNMSQLPAFLVENSGLNSGFMLAQVTAAALVSENKSFAHPASVDSLPTSANQEDHVSMATFAARRLQEMIDNSNTIVAIELLAAAQGIDLRKPLVTSPLLQKVIVTLRQRVAFYKKDRFFSPDIVNAKKIVVAGELNRFIGVKHIPSFNAFPQSEEDRTPLFIG